MAILNNNHVKVRPPVAVSNNSRVVLERRYLKKNDDGEAIETPEELFGRVANNIAQAERRYAGQDPEHAADQWEDRFYRIMASMEFMPNSPTLMNAGRDLQQLSACFVLPVDDSIEGIFESIKHTALIHKSGGGTGFSFSRVRPEGDRVKSTMGVASGPVSFLKIFDCATEQIKQGGTRRGANMGILAVDHPDVESFITMKSDMVTLTNFNISVAVTEEFMQAVERGESYALRSPRTGEPVGTRDAREMFDRMVTNAWRNGDPGLIFIDRINASESNPTPKYGRIEATNPCGEEPLFPYESCNLGSINLAMFVKEVDGKKTIDYAHLGEVVDVTVRFLDNVIDMNRYPIPQIQEWSHKMRRIGLGVMGFADLLFQLKVPYNSEEGVRLGQEVMGFIQQRSNQASIALAAERNVYPAWEDSIHKDAGLRYRNCNRTVIAPTGTISIIADCSSGIEPIFALAFVRQHFLDPKDPSKRTQLTDVNDYFLRVAKEEGFHSEELMQYLAEGGKLADRPEVPEWVKQVYVTAHDISPEWHVRMQAAFQRHTDNAVSKTINFPFDATVEDVMNAYRLAYEEGCKGITIYREGSRDWSVLSHAKKEEESGTEEGEGTASLDLLPPSSGTPSATPYRRRLPNERQSITHKFTVGGQEGYLTVGLFDDGTPGEIFIKISKEGSTVSGLMDTMAVLTSMTLQYGVPLEDLVRKLKNTRFEPYGPAANREIPFATSLVDYIYRWLEIKFVPADQRGGNGHTVDVVSDVPIVPLDASNSSGVGCPECGSILAYQEGCLVCRSCGYSTCS